MTSSEFKKKHKSLPAFYKQLSSINIQAPLTA